MSRHVQTSTEYPDACYMSPECLDGCPYGIWLSADFLNGGLDVCSISGLYSDICLVSGNMSGHPNKCQDRHLGIHKVLGCAS